MAKTKTIRPQVAKANDDATVRHDMKDVPKHIYTALAQALYDLRESTGISVTIKDATVRGMALATEELKHARGPDAIRKIYER